MLGFTSLEKVMTNKPHKIVILDHCTSHLTQKVEDAMDAKAFIALSEKLTKTKFKIYEDFQKKAKKIVEEMDEVMRVFVAEELREEYLAPQEDDETVVCEHCDLVRSESDYVDCTCDKERMTAFAEEIGACLSDPL